MIDLKATDGSREYGTFGMRAGLLTLEQYGKYQDIIPLADNWWCLATPWRTPNPWWLRSPSTDYTSFVWLVFSYGGCGHVGATGTYGIRPALYFTSDLLVSIEDEGEEDAAADETALYREYRAYVKDWLEGNADTGKSPLSYEDRKAD
jgi:hypothetical protein